MTTVGAATATLTAASISKSGLSPRRRQHRSIHQAFTQIAAAPMTAIITPTALTPAPPGHRAR